MHANTASSAKLGGITSASQTTMMSSFRRYRKTVLKPSPQPLDEACLTSQGWKQEFHEVLYLLDNTTFSFLCIPCLLKAVYEKDDLLDKVKC